MNRREIDEHFKSSARNFLGSRWSFYELHNGRAFWIHKSGKVVPSSPQIVKPVKMPARRRRSDRKLPPKAA